MVNKSKLKGVMAEKGFSQVDVAKMVGISENSFSSKLNGKTKFYINEATKICQCLEINDCELKCQIFLS